MSIGLGGWGGWAIKACRHRWLRFRASERFPHDSAAPNAPDVGLSPRACRRHARNSTPHPRSPGCRGRPSPICPTGGLIGGDGGYGDTQDFSARALVRLGLGAILQSAEAGFCDAWIRLRRCTPDTACADMMTACRPRRLITTLSARGRQLPPCFTLSATCRTLSRTAAWTVQSRPCYNSVPVSINGWVQCLTGFYKHMNCEFFNQHLPFS